MQICTARKHGKCFVRGITAYIHSKIDGMLGDWQESQISAVRVIHEQKHSVSAAHLRDSADIEDVSKIIRARQIDCAGDFLSVFKVFFNILSAYITRKIVISVSVKPLNVNIKQSRSAVKGLVSIFSIYSFTAVTR